jgi:cytochrome c-type biogenesis protein CcmH/NrfF
MIDAYPTDFCPSKVAAAAEECLLMRASESCHFEERHAKLEFAMPVTRREIRFSLCALFLAAVLTFAVAPGLAQTAPPSAQMNMPPAEPANSSTLPTGRARDIAKQVMCTCGCGDVAGSCSHAGAAFSGPCGVAEGKLKEINERVGRGESNDSILKTFVQEYGEAVLAAPPVSGFNWFAYMFPAVAFAIGLGLVTMIIRQWRHRLAVAPASGPAVSAEMLAHARRQIARDVRDD